MAFATVLSVAQTLFAALQCNELREVCSILGYKSELENLGHTVNIVKAVLEEAESKTELPPQAQLYVDQLKDVVYDADDLIDEFVTLAQRKKLIKGGKVSEKVRLLFSRFNPLATAHRMAQGVKEIRKRLDNIASDHAKFGFKLDSQPTRRRREETCSYVYAKNIIGREDDVDQITHRLLDPDVHRDVSCLAVVGIGGLGKTALAQLVFNDPRIIEGFPLRVWTCVSDQDQKTLDVKDVLCKILHSITLTNHGDLTMEPLQKHFRDQLAEKKYLMVLDDVWSEDRRRLLELANYLMIGQRGSWIVVTTRSEHTAAILGDELVHKLKGLSEEDSWRLFERIAFEQAHREQVNTLDLEEIGRKIVKRCANVPLAIKVVGSLLHGHPKEKWLSFQKKALGKLKYGKNDGIEPILKLSYHNLESPLKTCFSYCALFPKDHVIEKEMLLNLWMAQGYVVPEEGQSIQDASDEYFLILVRRCFFQDIEKDEYGEIISCKIHDLMHDIGQEVAQAEIYATDPFTTNLDSRIRHLSYNSTGEGIQCSFTRSKLRTCLRLSYGEQRIPVGELLNNWLCLRALDLSGSRIKSLPNVLGGLLHLRYLDLSGNDELEMLPNSITKLHNLQVLNLKNCYRLKKLPKDLQKLVKLRVLYITSDCEKLNGMPRGMGKLSCLQKLPLFVFGDNNSTSKQSIIDQMEELKALTQLKGSLCIKILKTTEYLVENVGERSYIKNKELLNDVTIEFARGLEEGLLLEDLKPHPKLRNLQLMSYGGRRLPSWAIEDNLTISLPNLVGLYLYECTRLQQLPMLRKLCNLKSLRLVGLSELEYIENTRCSRNMSDGAGTWESQIFFPSLEKFYLERIPMLKGWWSNTEHECHVLPCFPRLSRLRINSCPNLTCIPSCTTLEELRLEGGFNEQFGITITNESGNSKLRLVRTSNMGHLTSILPMEAIQCLKVMIINDDKEVESLSEFEDVFRTCLSSLPELRIIQCQNLKSVRGLEHLTALKRLELWDLPSLSLSKQEEREEEDGMPWRCLHHSLRSLELGLMPKMLKLPDGMRHLTALQSLIIHDCKELESVPEWMPELTSLKTLEISSSSNGLRERCCKPTGEDWPNIQHIPDIYIS